LSSGVDRKLQHVAVAEFRYRHEAELAAGFLEDAGIPFRLQTDDAGGADLGLSMLRPSILWVRAVDAEVARELVGPGEEEPKVEPTPAVRRRPADQPVERLTVRERAVSGVLGVALLAVSPALPPSPFQTALVAICYVVGFVLLGAGAVGRAPGPIGGFIKMLSGSPPK
jgi:hypothetical protein